MTRDQRQQEALDAWVAAGYRGTIEGATGFGKTLVGLKATLLYKPGSKILISVPTTKLRDIDWPEEAAKWNIPLMVDEGRCRLVCHASMPTIQGEKFDLVILDEGHHLTYNKNLFFDNNEVRDVLCLTATYPTVEDYKFQLLNDLAPSVFVYTLDQAVSDGAVADYEIVVALCPLDDSVKHIETGPKKKRFFVTEKARYDSLTKTIQRMAIAKQEGAVKKFVGDRMRLMYNLKYTKTLPARLILKHMEDQRVLAVCGSIAQAVDLLGDQVYHSQLKPEYRLEEYTVGKRNPVTKTRKVKVREADWAYTAFLRGEIDKLAAVKALDEGVNIPMLDALLMLQATSEHRRMIQRLGRVLRARPGHKGLAIILCADCKVDKEWVNTAIDNAGLDKSKVTWIPLATLYKGFTV